MPCVSRAAAWRVRSSQCTVCQVATVFAEVSILRFSVTFCDQFCFQVLLTFWLNLARNRSCTLHGDFGPRGVLLDFWRCLTRGHTDRIGGRDSLNEFIRWCMDGVTSVAVRIASVDVLISAVQPGLQTLTSDLDPRTSRWASGDATGVSARVELWGERL